MDSPEDAWVATFPAGYADGFNRLFSNRGRVLINGSSYPVIGRYCMDQSMCLLGHTTDIKVGDEVVLIGKSGNEEITAYEWAEKLDTITYEVTCQINKRVKILHQTINFLNLPKVAYIIHRIGIQIVDRQQIEEILAELKIDSFLAPSRALLIKVTSAQSQLIYLCMRRI